MNEKQIEKLLRDNNVSVTENRKKIISCLVNDEHHFHTIAEITEHTKNLNTKSVYNNIKALIDAGLIDSYSFSGVSKFALNDNLISRNEIHIINEEEVKHLKIEDHIFEQIAKDVKDKGYKVKKVKIFVEVE